MDSHPLASGYPICRFRFLTVLCILRAGQPHIFVHTGYEKGERKEKMEMKMKRVNKTCFCFVLHSSLVTSLGSTLGVGCSWICCSRGLLVCFQARFRGEIPMFGVSTKILLLCCCLELAKGFFVLGCFQNFPRASQRDGRSTGGAARLSLLLSVRSE